MKLKKKINEAPTPEKKKKAWSRNIIIVKKVVKQSVSLRLPNHLK
jgi:hypothetical protein